MSFLLPQLYEKNADVPFCCVTEHGKSATNVHWHGGMEIIYMAKGESQVFFDNDWHALPQNSLLFVPEGKLHCCRCYDENAEKIVVGFTEKCFDTSRVYKAIPLSLYEHCIIKDLQTTPIPALLHDLYTYVCKKGHSNELRAKSCIINIFSYFLDYWQSLGVDVDNSSKRSIENEIIKYIEERYVEQLSPYDVAKSLNISYSSLAKKMQETNGCGFNKTLNKVRVEEAKRMLATTDKNVTEIALECGFYNVCYFIKTFKTFTGTTPKKFKALQQKQ